LARPHHVTSRETDDDGSTSGPCAQNGAVGFARGAPEDIEPIKAMFVRCSPQSRLRRFFRPVPAAPVGYLEEVLADHDNKYVLVIRRDGETIGLAELHVTGPASGDLAVIVEDSCQRRGFGTAALECIVCRARELGLRSLTADVQIENSHMVRVLERVGAASMSRSCDVVHVHVDLGEDGDPAEPVQLRAS
jgi:RimJ/RimL family protein N-acetyltransferase